MSWKDISENLTDSIIDVFSESIEISLFNKTSNGFDVAVINGVFNSSYKQIDINGNAISSTDPMVEISIRSIPRELTKKDKVKARGILYEIREIQIDSSGARKLYLSR